MKKAVTAGIHGVIQVQDGPAFGNDSPSVANPFHVMQLIGSTDDTLKAIDVTRNDEYRSIERDDFVSATLMNPNVMAGELHPVVNTNFSMCMQEMLKPDEADGSGSREVTTMNTLVKKLEDMLAEAEERDDFDLCELLKEAVEKVKKQIETKKEISVPDKHQQQQKWISFAEKLQETLAEAEDHDDQCELLNEAAEWVKEQNPFVKKIEAQNGLT